MGILGQRGQNNNLNTRGKTVKKIGPPVLIDNISCILSNEEVDKYRTGIFCNVKMSFLLLELIIRKFVINVNSDNFQTQVQNLSDYLQ
jgi:hypothetical protein